MRHVDLRSVGQLEREEEIRAQRLRMYEFYSRELASFAGTYEISYSQPPRYASVHNAHIFFIILPTAIMRRGLEVYLNARQIAAYRHFVPLHSAAAGQRFARTYSLLPVTETLAERILRLPLSSLLSLSDAGRVITAVKEFLTHGQ
jgi:dTDP-4-amino-4,6-dideoxygalactose transaminase